MKSVRRSSGWNMHGDDQVRLLWLNSKDRPKGSKGAKRWGIRWERCSKHEAANARASARLKNWKSGKSQRK